DPSTANCASTVGFGSTLAPMSSSAHSPALVAKVVTMAGRSTPGSRPSTNRPHAIIAPEFPADTTASASPALTMSKQRRIVHGDDVGRVTHDNRILLVVRPERRELRAKARLVTDQNHLHAARPHGRQHAFELDARRGVGSHGVDGDSGHGGKGPRGPYACSSSFGSITSRSR